jgi:hypothetical protein
LVRISGRGRESGLEMEMRPVREGKVIRGEVYRMADEALEAARQGE